MVPTVTKVGNRSPSETQDHVGGLGGKTKTILFGFGKPITGDIASLHTVQITFIFIDFRVCDFAFAFKTQNAPCKMQTRRAFDLSPRLMHLTSHITHSNGYAPCIAYYRSNGVDQLFRKLKPKPKLNPPNAHRSPIKICEKWHTHNVQFPFMPNAFRILKPIQKSSKCV